MSFFDLFRPQSEPNRSASTYYPMDLQNGKVVGAWHQGQFEQRAPFSEDYDFTQRTFRRYVDASGASSVFFPNGFTNRAWQGVRFPYRGAGYLWTVQPRIPGQTRGNYGGFYPREPSPEQLRTVVQATAGSQPVNPAGMWGPGAVSGDGFYNPMTG